jgi:hypothetical protein
MATTSSQISKFEITAYEDVDCTKAVAPTSQSSKAFDSSKLKYVFPFIFNTLKLDNSHSYNNNQPVGFSGIDPKFKNIKPKNLRVDLIIDPGSEPDYSYSMNEGMPIKESFMTLTDRLELFEKIVGYNSSTHRPNYLLLSWGSSFSMKATLSSYSISYDRFNDKGEPTKSTIKAVFQEVISSKKMLSEQDRQSPDVSHSIEIEDGENLIQLCERVYGDSKYYLQIAKINGLTSIRNIPTGTRLYFPPLK